MKGVNTAANTFTVVEWFFTKANEAKTQFSTKRIYNQFFESIFGWKLLTTEQKFEEVLRISANRFPMMFDLYSHENLGCP